MWWALERHIDETQTVQEATRNYFEANNEIREEVDRYFTAYRYLGELIPQPLEKLTSGHFFPYTESYYELENALILCHIGLYRYAFIALRTVLELGLLSVFWDRKDKAHVEIKDWIRSERDTPFKEEIWNGLIAIDNIREFDRRRDFKERVKEVYGELSNYIHTKGYRYSSTGQTSLPIAVSVIRFSENTLREWQDLMQRVVEINCIVHVLKYPVALQYTPIEDKYGLNTPLGGLLPPWKAEVIRTLFDEQTLPELQSISDDDSQARRIAEQINSMPDVTDREFSNQLLEWDKYMIENSGFQHWLAQQRKLLDVEKMKEHRPAEYNDFLNRARTLAKWAKENNLVDRNRRGQKIADILPDTYK